MFGTLTFMVKITKLTSTTALTAAVIWIVITYYYNLLKYLNTQYENKCFKIPLQAFASPIELVKRGTDKMLIRPTSNYPLKPSLCIYIAAYPHLSSAGRWRHQIKRFFFSMSLDIYLIDNDTDNFAPMPLNQQGWEWCLRIVDWIVRQCLGWNKTQKGLRYPAPKNTGINTRQ